MTEQTSGRGWMAVLAAMVLVTVACVVGYALAPFDAPTAEAADTGTPGLVGAGDRIVAITDDGALVVLDRRDGSRSETVLAPGEVDAEAALDVGEEHGAAYVVGPQARSELRSVSVRSGRQKHLADGRLVAVGPITFPQLARDIDRPRAEQLATVLPADGVDAIEVQNLVTGSTESIGPRSDDPPFRTVDDLAWSPFDNRLFGIADDGELLFRFDADRATTLEEAVVARLPSGIERWLDATPWGDGLAVLVERPDGSREVVEVDRRTLAPAGTLFTPSDGSRPVAIDADAATTRLLVVTDDGTLLVVEPGSQQEPTALAAGIAHAAW